MYVFLVNVLNRYFATHNVGRYSKIYAARSTKYQGDRSDIELTAGLARYSSLDSLSQGDRYFCFMIA